VYEYVPGARRTLARSTRAHATIELDGEEQAEIWSAHRVGGRPHVALEHAAPPGEARAVCAGWSRPGAPVRRAFVLEAGELRIADEIGGSPGRVVARIPLAPGLVPRLEGGRAEIALARGGSAQLELPAELAWRAEQTPYYPEFGREVARSCLVGEGRASRLAWRLRARLPG
jgi:hypothetical protein